MTVAYHRRRLLQAVLAALGAGGTPAIGRTTRNGFDVEGALVPVDEILHGGPPKDGIPAIDRPRFIATPEAKTKPDDRVLGIARNGIARAYPLAIMNWHEIVNDRFGDEPVVVTFCPLCGTGMAFLATVDGKALDFGVSGLLYNSDVLLYDRQTQSLWSQLLGRAVTGPMKGRKLTAIAISHTSWGDWRRRHPRTAVLSEETGFWRDYGRNPYEGYEQSRTLMFRVHAADDRYHPKEYVIGLELGDASKAYPFSELLRKGPSFADTVAGHSVRVEFDAAHRTGRVLDAQGNEIPTVIAFWFAWYAFHPQTEVFTAAARVQ